MRLTELEPSFVVIIDDTHERWTDEIAGADGILFLCPKCFETNGGPVGTHRILCYTPHVPQTRSPAPGRWNLVGTGYEDLTLEAGSSSILLTSGCQWHGFIRNGEVINA